MDWHVRNCRTIRHSSLRCWMVDDANPGQGMVAVLLMDIVVDTCWRVINVSKLNKVGIKRGNLQY